MIKKERRIIYLAGFLFALPFALTSYINSSFLESYMETKYVGLVYIIASIITIFGLVEISRILRNIGNRNATMLFSLVTLFSLIGMAFLKQQLLIVICFILYFVSASFIMVSLDIFIEELSKAREIGRIRGTYLVIANLAWVLSQAISGSIIAKSSYKGIYLFSALFMGLVAGIFILFLKNFEDPLYKKISLLKTIKLFLKDKNISKIYIISFILKFFYAWMVIYTPIYLHQYLHFGWDKIGLIFTIMLIPFVILDMPLGRLSDKIGEKKMLIVGLFITTFFTLIIPFVTTMDWKIWAMILFGTRVGAAAIEVMSDNYFFKIVTAEKADVIVFFRNTSSLSYIIGPLIAIPILLYIPSFKYLFFVLGAILLSGVLISIRLKEVK
ncbi:MAG: MFS transporter [Candidatus Nomurabacteria bacterium]|nr:MFS transporter [Candidatus Nomurabacteria bacterium]